MWSRGILRSFSDFKRHPWLHLVSIATVTLSLLILGGFFLCLRNLESLADTTRPEVTGTLYLKDGLKEHEIEALKARVSALPNVVSAEFKNRNTVVTELQAFLGEASSTTLTGGELFPDVIEVGLDSKSGVMTVNELSSVLGKMPEISEVDFSEDWLLQYKKVRSFLRGVGAFLLFALLVGCSFLIANFMSMRHQSRREEIEIVRLMGAKRAFVFLPFLWEGLVEGLLGALGALALLYTIKSAAGTVLQLQWSGFLGIKHWLFLSSGQIFMLLVVGILMAMLGGLTVFLRFRDGAEA